MFPCCTYSSVRGVIFFSGSSSSANSFLYFSQLCPVALGILGGVMLCLLVGNLSQSVNQRPSSCRFRTRGDDASTEIGVVVMRSR